MTFDEFWEKNYAKDFGECEPYYGIASHAFEIGRRQGDEDIIAATQREVACCNETISKLRLENELLEEQIEKMKCCQNCRYWYKARKGEMICNTGADYCCDKWEMKK